ncbi:MAG: PD40 domain-containing protein [Armatimonadetes bacterium]|nr:PD40 domain-containing protein [Armatimonadota bacterium]
MTRVTLLAMAASLAVGAAATPVLRATHPAISPDGSKLCVSYQGDLWIVPRTGGEARRITVHPAKEQMPRWTPDGSRIVFVSDRYGNSDVFSIKPDGSDLKRLNYESSNEQVFSVDKNFVYGYTTGFGRSDIFRVPLSGGSLIRMTGGYFELEYYPSPSADGKHFIFNSGASGGSWRRPRQSGSNTGEIFIADATVPAKNFKKLTENLAQDLFPMVAGDKEIVFVSNRAGVPNLWQMGLDGKNAKQLTQFTQGTLRWPSISPDGRWVAFEQQSRIYTLDRKTGKAEEVKVDVPEDERIVPTAKLTLTTGANDFAVAPDGKRMVVALRGDLWLIPEKGGTTRKLTSSLAMDNQPLWLDKDRILFCTGRTGKRELWTVDLKGNEKAFYAAAEDVGNPQMSPDGKTIAVHRGDHEIVTLSTAGGPATVVATGAFGFGFAGDKLFAWSPDSRYLLVQMATDRGGTNLDLVDVATKKHETVAWLARSVDSLSFLPNGKGIYFLAREFEDNDLFVVDLVPDEPKFNEDDLDLIDQPKKEEKKEVKVEVYLPGIEDRLRQISNAGAFAPLASSDSKTIYAVADGQLTAFNVATGFGMPVTGVTSWGNPKLGPNGKTYFVSAGKLMGMAAGQAPSPINYSAETTVNLRDEEKELFNEIWWAMDRFYYRPDMNNVGWENIKARYAKILPYTTGRADFYALMDEMLEELESSHLGATEPADPPSPGFGQDSTAMIGVEWDWGTLEREDRYVVASVLPGSPAANPSSLLSPGDVIERVNGVALGKEMTFARAMNGLTSRKTVLTVRGKMGAREVTIKPSSPGAWNGLAYQDWVERNRAFVEKISNGQVGYLHYASMNQASQDLFVREIRTKTIGKKALIIDVRYNGGGSTAQQALGVLIKSPWLIRTRRDFPELKLSENIYRGDSLELPSALMTNQYSFSNAEIMSEGFKRLKVGPVVGEATAGGVIGTSSWSLWDGGQIRMPASGAYAIDGENLENKGRQPDIKVLWDMNAALEGRDVQLEAAVKELLKKVK